MIARVKFASALFKVGLYEKRGAVALLVSVASWMVSGADLLVQVSMLPAAKLPPLVVEWLRVVGPWGLVAGFVAQFVLAQSKKVLPAAPMDGAPSLLDDETGS